MDLSIIYTKTAKGILDLKSGARNLQPGQITTLQRIDGRSSVASLIEGMSPRSVEGFRDALKSLEAQGAIKIFTRGAEPIATAAVQSEADPDHLPLIQIEELDQEEGVRAWAEARRGARDLSKHGFMMTGHASATKTASEEIRLLIVEDDESIAQLMQTYLNRRGFLTQVASDGMIALEMLDQDPPPDLALLDVNLPIINGFDVLEHIRAHPKLHGLPAIMVTAQVSEADVLRGLNAGADGYIFKPFEWSALHDCISQVLGIRQKS